MPLKYAYSNGTSYSSMRIMAFLPFGSSDFHSVFFNRKQRVCLQNIAVSLKFMANFVYPSRLCRKFGIPEFSHPFLFIVYLICWKETTENPKARRVLLPHQLRQPHILNCAKFFFIILDVLHNVIPWAVEIEVLRHKCLCIFCVCKRIIDMLKRNFTGGPRASPADSQPVPQFRILG